MLINFITLLNRYKWFLIFGILASIIFYSISSKFYSSQSILSNPGIKFLILYLTILFFGVDMTEKMISIATENAKKYGYKNVEFRLGDIDQLPVESNSIDVIISNCVINLAPDKLKVFREAYRVLKKNGRMFISDIVLLEDLSDKQRNNEELICSCVGGALLKDIYLKIIRDAGFKVRILLENMDISKKQYQGIPLESLSIEAIK